MNEVLLEMKVKSESGMQYNTMSVRAYCGSTYGYYRLCPCNIPAENEEAPVPYIIHSAVTKENVESLLTIEAGELYKTALDAVEFELQVKADSGESHISGRISQYMHSPIVKGMYMFYKRKMDHYNDIYEEDVNPILRLFYMVHLLHKEGYEQLRLCTAISPTGMSMRCMLTTKQNCSQMCGIMPIEDNPEEMVFMVDGMADWAPEKMSALDMMEAFKRLYPTLLKQCKRLDPDYKEWFMLALDESQQNHFMYAMDDFTDCLHEGYVMLTGVHDHRGLPFPPKGYGKVRP